MEAPSVTHAPRGVRGVAAASSLDFPEPVWAAPESCAGVSRACTRSGLRSPETESAGMGPRSPCPASAPTATAGPPGSGLDAGLASCTVSPLPSCPPGPHRSPLGSVSGSTVFAPLALCVSAPQRPPEVLTLPGWLLRCPRSLPPLLPAPAGSPAEAGGVALGPPGPTLQSSWWGPGRLRRARV